MENKSIKQDSVVEAMNKLLKEKASACKFTMTDVNSSNVKSVGYNEINAVAIIQFHNGNRYAYFDVSSDEYKILRESDSVGKYVPIFAKRFKYVKM